MTREQLNNDYFESLVGIVCRTRFPEGVSYRKLLTYLHNTDFRYVMPRDKNRAEGGKDLRWRFALACGYEDIYEDMLTGPCSVLEMMVALALVCEEQMDDPLYGDRTAQWFWSMVVSLGLGSMMDSRFDARYVEDVIERFLDRDYEPDGRGGLFTIRNCDRDVRDMEIWHQLCYYLDGMV